MIEQYLLGYSENSKKYALEFDFNNSYIVRRIYTITLSLFKRALNETNGENLIVNTFKNATFVHILQLLDTINEKESLFKNAVLTLDYEKALLLLRPELPKKSNIIRRTLRKLKYTIFK